MKKLFILGSVAVLLAGCYTADQRRYEAMGGTTSDGGVYYYDGGPTRVWIGQFRL